MNIFFSENGLHNYQTDNDQISRISDVAGLRFLRRWSFNVRTYGEPHNFGESGLIYFTFFFKYCIFRSVD